MSRLIKLIGLLALPLLFACSSGNNNKNSSSNSDPVQESSQIRITHASADAPAVNVYVDGDPLLEGAEFKESSGLIEINEPGAFEVEVRGILPDKTEVTVIGPLDLTLDAGERTDVIAIGNLFNESGDITIAPRVLEPVDREDSITDVRVSVLHAATAVPAVDIYVTAPGDELANTAPITTAFGDAAGPVALEADTSYQVRVTLNGSPEVAFDSGTLSFAAGTELVLAAVENTYKLKPSPVTLLVVGPGDAS